MKRRPRASERGYAVLMVFMIAATIVIYLYMQMPRVAFEAQRAKEELLIERGEQYKRAIQLFVRHNKTYPSKIEDLENFNGKRYLRRRYKDPMSGKEDWRPIHVGPGGVFLDSIVYKQKAATEKAEKKPENTFISEGPSMAAPEPGAAQPGVTVALRTRPSDRPGAPGSGAMPGGVGVPGVPGTPTDPQAQPYPGAQGLPGQPQSPFLPVGPPPSPGAQQVSGQIAPGQPGAPVQVMPGQAQPGQAVPGQPFIPGLPGVTAAQFQAAAAPPGAQLGPSYIPPGAAPPPVPVSGAQPPSPGASPNAALEMIQKLLTTPRPGGLGGAPAQQGGQVIGGGIAGFASRVEAEGIKVYRERTKYNEWEFIYDIKEDLQKSIPAGLQQPGASPSKETGSPKPSTGSPGTPFSTPSRRSSGNP